MVEDDDLFARVKVEAKTGRNERLSCTDLDPGLLHGVFEPAKPTLTRS